MQADVAAVVVLVLAACVTCRAASTTGAQDRADADAEAGSSFFDTFMAFLGSSTLGADQGPSVGAAQGRDAEAAASSGGALASAGRSLGDLSEGAPSATDGAGGERVKRTGQIPGQLLSAALSHKLGYISKGSNHVHFHNYGTKCEKPHWSLWEFKKALLGKLLDAAKAIGGGVLALKGKLITAKGHLVAAKGRKLASKGEELTDFGKSILAKALGHGPPEEVHTAPSAPAAPLGALHAGGPAPYAPAQYAHAPYPPAHYSAAQYLPPAPVPSGHGYGEAVSLLNEYSRGSSANAHFHRSGQAPTGPSGAGSTGTLPANLQAGLLVLQPAPSAAGRMGVSASAASAPAATYSSPAKVDMPQGGARPAPLPPHPLVFAPEYMNAMSAAQQIAEAAEAAAAATATESNKVRRYAVFSNPTHRRSLDDAMASVVWGLHGSHLLLDRSIVRNAAAHISTV